MGYDLGKRESRAALLPETGILITRIERDSPVDQTGISRGDTIIAINGRPVDGVVALRDELHGYAPGDSVMITYRHDLVEQATYVTLGHFPGSVNTPYLGIYYTARAESPADM
jgi:S1-C subfamily serine protease